MGFEWVEQLAKMNPAKEIRNVLQRKEVQDAIIKLNTTMQLYDVGENSLGVKLSAIGGGYSPYTKQIKLSKGLPIDRITLKDTGEFYASFKINILANGDFEIIADPKKDDDNLYNRWGDEIVGLQSKNLAKVLAFIEAEIMDKLLIGVNGHVKQNLQIA